MSFALPWETVNRGQLLARRIQAIASVMATAMHPKSDVPPDDIGELMWVVWDFAKELDEIVATKAEGAPVEGEAARPQGGVHAVAS